MKGLVFADCHLDTSTAGMRRIDDLECAFNNIVSLAVEHKVDAVFCLGDLSDPDAGSILIRVLDASLKLCCKLRLAGIESIWISGNHDVVEDGSGLSTIHPLRHVARIFESPAVEMVQGHVMAFLPYTSRTMKYDPAQVISQSTRQIECVMGHCTVIPGARAGSESGDLARGGDLHFPEKECKRAGVKFMANGHLHFAQTTPGGIHVPGSLERLRFDEEHNSPGVLIFEL